MQVHTRAYYSSERRLAAEFSVWNADSWYKIWYVLCGRIVCVLCSVVSLFAFP